MWADVLPDDSALASDVFSELKSDPDPGRPQSVEGLLCDLNEEDLDMPGSSFLDPDKKWSHFIAFWNGRPPDQSQYPA